MITVNSPVTYIKDENDNKHIIELNNQNHSIVIQGKIGTGKTTTVKRLLDSLICDINTFPKLDILIYTALDEYKEYEIHPNITVRKQDLDNENDTVYNIIIKPLMNRTRQLGYINLEHARIQSRYNKNTGLLCVNNLRPLVIIMDDHRPDLSEYFGIKSELEAMEIAKYVNAHLILTRYSASNYSTTRELKKGIEGNELKLGSTLPATILTMPDRSINGLAIAITSGTTLAPHIRFIPAKL